MKKIKIILADDHAILRYGIRTFLSTANDIEIVGEAATGEECIKIFKEQMPDVCVLDIGMPGKNGIEVVEAIRSTDSSVKILILSMHSDEHILRKSLKAGINGYLSKNTPKKKILQAIRTVAGGEKVFSDSITSLNPKLFCSELPNNKLPSEKNITIREMDVLKLVVAGYSSPQIAKQLYISPRTVDTHRTNMMQKLDIHNTASLVRFAMENDLVNTA